MKGEKDMMHPPHADAIVRHVPHTSLPELLLNMRSATDIERAIRAASIAGGVAAGTQALFTLWRTYHDGASMFTGLGLMGALITLGFVYGVMRGSRLASVGLVAFYMLSQFLVWRGLEQGSMGLMGGMLALVLVFFMVRGVQATFTFHRMERQFDSWQRTMDSTLDPRLFDDEDA